MFTQQDINGIELQKLVQYIIQHNKQQKQHYTTDTIYFDHHLQQQYMQDQNDIVDSKQNFINNNSSNQSYDIKDDDQNDDNNSSERDVMGNIKQSEQVEMNDQQSKVVDNQNSLMIHKNDNHQFMLTKPQIIEQPSNKQKNKIKKVVNFTHNNKHPNRQSLLIKNNKNKKNIQQHSLTPINMKSIMLSLKNNTIDYLKTQFIQNKNKITLQKFLWLMKQCITYDKWRQYQIMYELIKLFEEIDIDCNQFIDWNQFLDYLACYGWVSDSNNINHENTIGGNDTNTHNSGQRGKKPNYIIQQWTQTNKHRKNTLNKIIEIQKLDMLCLVQTRNFTLSFLNKRGQKYMVSYQKRFVQDNGDNNTNGNTQLMQHSKNNYDKRNQQRFSITNKNNKNDTKNNLTTTYLFSINHIDHKKVLSIDYSQPQKLFGVLQTDRKVYFIEEGEIQKSWGKVQGTGNEIDIMYLPLHKKWLLKRIDQYIDIFSSPKDKYNKQRITFKPHDKQAITAIKQIKQPLSLITSGLDGKIKVWTLQGRQLLIELRPLGEQETMLGSLYQGKTMGVKGLDTLNIGIQSYFCSWTFTTEIMLWLPSASISKPYIGKLKGHSGIVQSCQFIKPQHCSKHLLISIDNKKVIKLWSVQKMQCLQSIVHEGTGCKIKCLNNSPVVMVYDKVIEFNKLRLNSLMLSSQKEMLNNNNSNKMINDINSNDKIDNNLQNKHLTVNKLQHLNSITSLQQQQQQQSSSQQQFLQLQFCNHNILLLLLLSTQLRIINLKTGRVQFIIQPLFKDQQQFIHMSLKINRRVFILSTLGYIYYVKLDDGVVIKRIQVMVNSCGRQMKENVVKNDINIDNRNHNYNHKERQSRILNNNKQNNNQHTIQPSTLHNNKPSSQHQPFIPRFTHYHNQSKILLIIVQLQQSSLLITYNQSHGYQFQKMKQIQFQQYQLINLFFFNCIDVMVIADGYMVTVWDWKRVNLMNCVNFKQQQLDIHNKEKQQQNTSTIKKQYQQPYIKHITIHEQPQSKTNLFIILNKYQQISIYDINPQDFSMKKRLSLVINTKQLKSSSISSICVVQSSNDELQNILVNKMNTKSSKNNLNPNNNNIINTGGKDKQVKFNNQQSLGDQQNNDVNNKILMNQNKSQKRNSIMNQMNNNNNNNININTNINNYNQNNSLNSFKQTNIQNKNTQKNSCQSKTKKTNTFLYITTSNGHILVYTLNEIINMLKYSDKQNTNQTNYIQKKSINIRRQSDDDNNIVMSNNNNNNKSLNQQQFAQKKYVAHKIRQNRKTNFRTIFSQQNNNLTVGIVDMQDYLIVQKQAINVPWTSHTLKQIYPDMLYGMSQMQQIIIFKSTCQIVGEWNVRSMLPKRWELMYQLVPKVVERLNKLQMILKLQYEEQKKVNKRRHISSTSKNSLQNLQTNKTNVSKILFLANRYLDEKDLMQLRQSIKIQTTKMISMSKKNILYKKSSSGQINQQKANDYLQGNNYLQTKKNSLTIKKQTIQKNMPTSIKNILNKDQKNFSQIDQTKHNNNRQVKDPSLMNNSRRNRTQNNTVNKSNFFEEKFIQKIEDQNRLKINKQFIDKQVENTLNHAKKLQLKTMQNFKIKQRYSLNAEANRNSFLNEKNIQDKKQQQPTKQQLSIKNMSQKNVNLNTVSSKIPVFQTNQLIIQQQLQKNQIQKNINFVKRIQDSIQRIQMQYTTNWLKNKKVPQINVVNQKDAKYKKGQNKNLTNNIQNNQGRRSPNGLKVQSSHLRSRKVSITDKIQLDIDINDFSLGKQTIIKKNVGFSDLNKVIQYENSQSNIIKKDNQFIEKRKLSWKNNKPVRSLSAANHLSLISKQAQKNMLLKSRPHSKVRENFKSASIHNKKQPIQQPKQILIKSRSLYGTQFNKQKEMAINNFRQGFREFQTFYKKFGSDFENNQNIPSKKNRIKLN